MIRPLLAAVLAALYEDLPFVNNRLGGSLPLSERRRIGVRLAPVGSSKLGGGCPIR